MANSLYIVEQNGISIRVHIQPSASKTEFCGIHDHSLKLRLSARAIEGEANKALCHYLADFFKVTKNSVTITHGHFARKKTVFVEGTAEKLIALLPSDLTGG